MNARAAAALALLLCTGCTELFDSWTKHEPPAVSVSSGRSGNLKVSWSAPSSSSNSDSSSSSDDSQVTVVSYSVYRDGSYATTTTETSWTDTAAEPATQYSYRVSATFSDNTTSSLSGAVSGWYVPANDLVFGTAPGPVSEPGSAVTADGWYETILVKGWTYHFVAPGSAELFICDHSSPWNRLSLGTNSTFTWTADRTGDIWVRISPMQNLQAWYQ